jgi:signal transduction histidine kinase/ligand-binding sensor domain-containing protein
MRFDGVRFVPWLAPKGQSLLGRGFSYLLGARDGSLWIGTPNGLVHLEDGQFQTYASQPGPGIGAIIEDHEGTIWVTRYRIRDGLGALCRVDGKALHCYGKADGIPLRYAQGLTEDSSGNLWIAGNALCRWKPGSSDTYFEDEFKHEKSGNGAVDVTAGQSGSVWAALDGIGPKLGVRRYFSGKWSSYVVPGFDGAAIRASALFIDREKSLWIGTNNKGLYHVHNGVADHYGSADGLSGNAIQSIYEDHEGNLWVVTDGGMDLFRDTPVVSVTMHEGLSAANIKSVVALHSGAVWLANEGAVDILHADMASTLSVGHALPGHDVGSMFEDHSGALWLGVDDSDKLLIYDHGRLSEVKRPDGTTLGAKGGVFSITEDVEHNIWALTSGQQPHLFRITDRKVRVDIALNNQISDPYYLEADRQSGVWINSRRGVLTRYRDGRFQPATLGNSDTALGAAQPIIDSDNAVWVPTLQGLFRLSNGQLKLLDARNGLPCDSLFSVLKSNDGSLWLYARCGLIRIKASDVAKWLEHPDSHLEVETFDGFDGAQAGGHSILSPISSVAPDGRLWFTNGFIAQMIDPDHVHKNVLPPPVHIEEMIADHKSHKIQEHLRLPALTHELEIDYTALSFSVPRKVRFRYRLDGGRDAHWEEPGLRRQAFYSDLGPGKYRFSVVACNNDGVWNNVGATLDFSIAPAWYQTYLFRLLCVIGGILIIWAFYRFRVRQIAKTINASFDERLAERTRLARELHDTLLQTIQGSKMVADDALDQPTDPVRTRRALEQLSEWQGQAMREVRTALNSLRSSTTQVNDLAGGLQRATEDCLLKGSMKVNFTVSGPVTEMHPIVRDEIYRIGYEAIRNADIHSEASLLEVELSRARDLTMRIRDNGTGIDPVTAAQGREGHFGLQGMRERAVRIGATLTIVSSANTGTELTLLVPGDIVFRKPSATPFKKIKALFSRIGQKSKLD